VRRASRSTTSGVVRSGKESKLYLYNYYGELTPPDLIQPCWYFWGPAGPFAVPYYNIVTNDIVEVPIEDPLPACP